MHHSTQAFLQAPAHYRACFPGDSVTARRSLRHPRDSERPDVLAPGPSRQLRPARSDSPGTSRYQTWPRHCLTRPAGPRSAPPAMLIGAHGLSSRLVARLRRRCSCHNAGPCPVPPTSSNCHQPWLSARAHGPLHLLDRLFRPSRRDYLLGRRGHLLGKTCPPSQGKHGHRLCYRHHAPCHALAPLPGPTARHHSSLDLSDLLTPSRCDYLLDQRNHQPGATCLVALETWPKTLPTFPPALPAPRLSPMLGQRASLLDQTQQLARSP